MAWDVNNHISLIGRLAGDLHFCDEDDVRHASFDLAMTEVNAAGVSAGHHLHRVSCRYFEAGLCRRPEIGEVLFVQGTLLSRLLDDAGHERAVHEVWAHAIRLLQHLPGNSSRPRFDNHVTLVGRLATRPEHFGDGDYYGARFDLASTEVCLRDGQARERTHLHRVVCWYDEADACHRRAVGDVLVVRAILHSRFVDAAGTEHVHHELRAHGVQFIDDLPGAPD